MVTEEFQKHEPTILKFISIKSFILQAYLRAAGIITESMAAAAASDLQHIRVDRILLCIMLYISTNIDRPNSDHRVIIAHH
jgi:hypothetical protein